MKKTLSFIGVIVVLGFVAFLETPSETYQGFTPSFEEESEEDTEEVSAEVGKGNDLTPYSSIEYRKEGTKLVDGYRVETYREYEIYTDEEGNVVKEVPTSNYDYLRYKIEQE